MDLKFYVCEHCGNIIVKVKDSGVPVVCCGEAMKELVPGTTDAALEKHVPVYAVDGTQVRVTVGSVAHPMLPEHFIQWIAVKTLQGCQMKHLEPGQKPEAVFALTEGDKVEAVFEYCNLHGLWKA
ncbi:MAG: desulfoferrodoxin family protein [Anaerovibrio sp.]|nr:desulfoferrodoxin family protein [Anaerovibrio sp.]